MASPDSNISHNEFEFVNNGLKGCNNIKVVFKNPNNR